MLLPPQNLQVTYNAGTITVSWQIAPNSDTPTMVQVSLSPFQVGSSVQVNPSATSQTFPATVVNKYAGTTVTVTVAFAVPQLNEHTNALGHVNVPGTPPPPAPSQGAPTNLAVSFNAAAHSAQFHWQNHGLHSGNYDKVLVQWGLVNDPNPVQLPDQPGMTTQVSLGPIYPNANYVFKAKGGMSNGWGYNYTDWATLTSQSPNGTQPFVGWLNSWFQINAGTPLLPTGPRIAPSPHKSVTAVWGIGDRSNHLDIFLAGGIPTLGVVWWDSWQANTQWVPWANVANAVWKLNVFVALGAEVTAVWRPNSTHLDLFAVANDGTVWSTWWEPNPGWQQWFPLSGAIATPGASVTAVWRPNATHLDLFVTGSSGALGEVWSTSWESGKWNSWFIVSNAVLALMLSVKPGAKVTALWRGNDHLDLLATAGDGSVWSTWWESSPGWQKWFAIDPQVKSSPGAPVSAIWSASGVLELFTTLGDGTVVTNSWTSSGWKNWTALPGSTKLSPGAAVSIVLNQQLVTQVEIFGTDTKGTVWTNSRQAFGTTSPWQGWFAIRPGPSIEPGATVAAVWRPTGSSANPTHLDLFVRGNDGSVWSIWWEPGYWS